MAIAVAAGTDSIGFSGGPLPWCNHTGEMWMEWTFFYGPMCGMVVVTLILMVVVIVAITCRLLRNSPTDQHGGGASKRAFLRFIQYNKRPLMFVGMGLVWFIFLLANKLDAEIKGDIYEDGLVEFGTCLIRVAFGVPGLDCGEKPVTRPFFGLTVGLVICVPGLGLYAIVVYGFNIVLFDKWKAFLTEGFVIPMDKSIRFSEWRPRKSVAFSEKNGRRSSAASMESMEAYRSPRSLNRTSSTSSISEGNATL